MLTSKSDLIRADSGRSVILRRFPYPYKAMMAICSDLDETPDRTAYWSVMQFLNSRDSGPLGAGVGLEVGNSIYFDMPPQQFAYWNTDDRGRAMIRALIRSGHIDCLHSFGDLATNRGHAGRALEELTRHDCRLIVWIDHAVAASNFGSDIMKGFGDLREHPAYHADLTTSYGIRYVWRGRVTSVIGQDQPPSLKGLWNRRHRGESLRTLAKEAAKWALSGSRRSRYRMHHFNRVANQSRLRDGTPVVEFLRCNPHWGGVSSCDTADGIADVLTAPFLDQLVRRRGSCILYTHLGKRRRSNGGAVLSAATLECFRRLAERQARGDVLVTTTRRLLDYAHTRDQLQASVSTQDDRVCFDLSLPGSNGRTEQLQGMTFYTDTPATTDVRFNGRPLTDLVRNAPDQTGRPSVTVRRNALEFPEL